MRLISSIQRLGANGSCTAIVMRLAFLSMSIATMPLLRANGPAIALVTTSRSRSSGLILT